MRTLLLAPLLLLPLLVGGCAQDDDAVPSGSSSRGAGASRSASPTTASPTTAAPTAAAPTEVAETARPSTGGPATGSPAGGGAKPVANCGGPTLDLSLVSRDSGAGHIDYTIAFTNRGRTACRVAGAPRAYVIDRNGDQLGREADGTGAEGPFVRLEPGRSATTVVRAVNVGTDGGPLGDTCTPEQGTAIAIDAPNYNRYEQVPADVRGCRETDVSFLSVGVLRGPAS